jgi:hypothetical protein
MNFTFLIRHGVRPFVFAIYDNKTICQIQELFGYFNNRFPGLEVRWTDNPPTQKTELDITFADIENSPQLKQWNEADLYRLEDIQPFIEPYNIPKEYQIFEFVMITNTWKYYKEFTSEMLFRVIQPIDTTS